MNANVSKVKMSAGLQIEDYISLVELKVSEEYVEKSNFSKETYKTMTLDVMDSVMESGDTETMHKVACVVAKCGMHAREWVSDLLAWINELSDASELLVCENNNATEVVVVVDDSTQDHVLDYNEFLFEIRSKYDEIHDFMVIDEELKAALPAMYTKVNCVYKRGE